MIPMNTILAHFTGWWTATTDATAAALATTQPRNAAPMTTAPTNSALTTAESTTAESTTAALTTALSATAALISDDRFYRLFSDNYCTGNRLTIIMPNSLVGVMSVWAARPIFLLRSMKHVKLDTHNGIFDIRITNTEGRTHRNKDPMKCLASQEKDKKGKYEEACHKQCTDFTPPVYSIDGMAGPKTRAAEKRLASWLAWKWKRKYSEMCGYVKCRMTIAVVRSDTLMWRDPERAGERTTDG